ncbi:MAG: hypothetical protein IJE43_03170 [Alphaproteobacteria bacterium]|nr:hypothetical protein [Alphaproteobacteria bacterium]
MTENQKKEAIKRMKALGLIDECIKAFEEDSEVWKSEPRGILFNLDQEPELRKIIQDFEQEHSGLVYHVVITYTDFGKLATMFYVTHNEAEWELDWNDLAVDSACCYVANIDDEELSEIGLIEFRSVNGGLERTA